MKTVAIIPCRYGAVRFYGKPLADIHGKPMMWHVYQRALQAKLIDEAYVATDDARIEEACKNLGLNVVMTRPDHPTGTDRVAEAADGIDADIYVNVQGDEPMIAPQAIDAVTRALRECTDPDVVASNAYALLDSVSDVIDTNNVKVIFDKNQAALCFSRQPIPYPKEGPATYNRQLGLYAFHKKGLEMFRNAPRGPIESAEGVEMLRFLENGYKLLMVAVEDHSIPVDTESDLRRVISLMAAEA